jgi:glucose-1-phosphate thymidylyltransferase
MVVIILAGGYAERLWPLTEEFPKALLSVGGKPVLQHLLENVSRIEDIKSITIAIEKDKEKCFVSFWNEIKASFPGPPPVFVPFDMDRGQVEGPLTKLREIIDFSENYNLNDDDVLILGGDNIFGFELNKFCEFYKEKNKGENVGCIAIHEIAPKLIDPSLFGLSKVRTSGRVTSIREKSVDKKKFAGEQKKSLVSTACYCFKKNTIQTIGEFLKLDKKESLGLYISWLAQRQKIMGFVFSEGWYDIGANRKNLLKANAMLIKDVKLPLYGSHTTITPPVYIERNAEISNARIGPNVYIGSGSKVTNSTVENSVIYKSCVLSNSTIIESIIGPGSIIEGYISKAILGSKTKISMER